MEIPEGWKWKKFGDVANFANGLNYTKGSHLYKVKIIGVGDFQKFSELRDFSHTSEILVENLPSPSSSLMSGDLLFVRSNGNKALVGRCLFLPSVTEELFYSGFTIRARVDKNFVRPKYAAYLTKSSIFKQQLHKFTGGSSITSLSQNTLHEFCFPMPPLDSQDATLEILGTWDRAIAVTEELIAASEAQKKALMQQLLTGKRRLPGFEEEWKEVKLGDMFDILTSPSKTKNIDNNGTKLIVDMGAIDRSSQLAAHKKIVARTHPLNEGDLVMPKDDIGGGQIIGRVAYIPDSFTYELGDHVYGLRHSTDEAVPLFSYYRINEFEVLKSLRRKANGTAQLGLGKKDVLKQIVSFPSQSEQRAISLILKGADKKIQGLQAKLQTLKTEKAALMQQLLTGKRRVKLTEAA